MPLQCLVDRSEKKQAMTPKESGRRPRVRAGTIFSLASGTLRGGPAGFPQDLESRGSYLVAATTTTTTAAATTAVAAATEVALDHRLGFVDSECAAIELRTAQPGNRLVGIVFTHFHETETLRPACIAIRNDRHRLDSSVLFKPGANIAFRGLKRQISDKQFLSHSYLPVL